MNANKCNDLVYLLLGAYVGAYAVTSLRTSIIADSYMYWLAELYPPSRGKWLCV